MEILTLISAALLGLTRPFCSIAVNPFSPGPSETYFWGVFSDEMVEAPPGDHPLGMEPGHWSTPDSGNVVYGQVVYIGEVAGHRASELRRNLGDRGYIRAVVVLWDYDAACEPTRFGNGTPWGIVGDSAYFRATLRERSEWVGELPTFDVYWAGEGIYPFTATKHGREFQAYLREEWDNTELAREEKGRLTAAQAFRLVRALPDRCAYLRSPLIAKVRLWWVMWRWREVRDYYPAGQILEQHRKLRDRENTYLKGWCESQGTSRSAGPPAERTSDNIGFTPPRLRRSGPSGHALL